MTIAQLIEYLKSLARPDVGLREPFAIIRFDGTGEVVAFDLDGDAEMLGGYDDPAEIKATLQNIETYLKEK